MPGVGQYDNIGDIVLRRQLLGWLRPLGRLHIYIGRAPEGYAAALGLSPDDVVYESFVSWYRVAVATALRGNASYVFKPGEIQLTLIGMKEHIGMLPLQVLIKFRGGRIVRLGAGSRDFAPLPRLLMRPSIALTDLVAWRDRRTADYLGTGAVMPDLAFGEGDFEASDATSSTRDTVVVSMRSDRPLPGPAWIAGVVRFADGRGLRLAVVTQVLRDRERSRELARLLGAELLDWDGSGHRRQEDALRALYRRSSVAVSDRLHVLVAAYTEGAVPLALLVQPSDKIDRHFSAAGIAGVAVDAATFDAEDVERALVRADSGRIEAFASLLPARAELSTIRGQLTELLQPTAVVNVRSSA